MAQIGRFTQPDNSPEYFIDFLDFLDKLEDIRNLRVEAAKHLNLSPGQRALDLGCGNRRRDNSRGRCSGNQLDTPTSQRYRPCRRGTRRQ